MIFKKNCFTKSTDSFTKYIKKMYLWIIKDAFQLWKLIPLHIICT